MTAPTPHRTTTEIRHALWEMYPGCFAGKGKEKAPLKIGIHKDIRAGGGFTSREIHLALRDYVGGPTYIRNVVEGADRTDLDGKPVGKVTVEEAKTAATRLRGKQHWQVRREMIAALKEARRFVAMNLQELLESCCVTGDDGEPDRSTIDEMDLPAVEDAERALAKIDAALARDDGMAA